MFKNGNYKSVINLTRLMMSLIVNLGALLVRELRREKKIVRNCAALMISGLKILAICRPSQISSEGGCVVIQNETRVIDVEQ